MDKDMGEFKGLVWAKRPAKLPEVFTTDEVDRVLDNLEDVFHLMGTLMYCSGVRLIECLRLRVKDIDFAYEKITVREKYRLKHFSLKVVRKSKIKLIVFSLNRFSLKIKGKINA